MEVVVLGDGAKWRVYAACTAGGDCPVLDLVLSLDRKLGARILSDLQNYVPESSSSAWANTRFSEPLTGTDGLLEFRWPTSRGGTPRVLWFYQPGSIVVCTHGINKKGRLANAEINAAAALKTGFELAVSENTLEVVSYRDFLDRE